MGENVYTSPTTEISKTSYLPDNWRDSGVYLHDEHKYYSGYKQIRNKFRAYSPSSILSGCIGYLYQPAKDETEQLTKRPWLILLLIKWVFIDEEVILAGRPAVTPKQLSELMQMLLSFESKARMPSQYEHYTFFLRNVAYQQFIYQHTFSKNSLARQKHLFGGVDKGHLFKAKFYELTGLEINRFLSLSLMLLTRFFDRKNAVISRQWFSPVFKHYPPEEVDNFLNCLAVPFSRIPGMLREHDKSNNRRSYEYYEQTPFLRRPLLRIGDDYWCVYPNVLYRTLEHFIYDTLREWDASSFTQKFGLMFERYVENILSYTGLRYVPESEFAKMLPGSGLLIDFLVADGDANVFVDAKAVEMAYQGKVAHASEVLKDRTRTSILKAIEQAHEVNKRLRDLDQLHPVARSRNHNYLIVVTYKELYLGNGATFYEAIAKAKIDEICEKYGSTVIPVEHMYFLTIEELELLAESIKVGKVGLVDALERAKVGDARPETRKFDFTLHLRAWGAMNAPKYLEETRESQIIELEPLFTDGIGRTE